MTRITLLTTLLLAILLAPAAPAAWSLKQAPLMTRWADDVDPANPLPDYPRPQLVRPDWLNLNGLWQFQPANAADPLPTGQTLAREILVPFPVESAISGVMEHHDRLWYRQTFTVPAQWSGQRILLHFGAVDYESQVYLNGHSLGIHRGGYDDFSYDITPFLNPAGPQELIVRVFDPTDAATIPLGKQRLNPHGIWYTPVTGIWQTVWLEPAPPVRIDSLKLTPDIDNAQLNLTANLAGAGPDLTVHATARDAQGQTVATASAAPNAPFALDVPEPHLWHPDDPYLYDLTVELRQDQTLLDSVDSYFAMRKITVEPVDGINRITLNNKFEFQIGPLDQGWWPDGLYTAPTDEALRYDIEITKDLGFNMTRKHVKIEPARWYYWTDKLGLLVWQDMPSLTAGRAISETDKAQFAAELDKLVTQHWNHPSIIMWVVFNEGWGQHDTVPLTEHVMALDPSRIVSDASGWTHRNVGHILDHHSYPWPAGPAPYGPRASVCGEYGGIGYAIDGHLWAGGSWGYTSVANAEELVSLYATYLQRALEFASTPGISAAVYTQITDVEIEVNGLLTYDRDVIKAPVQEIYNLNKQHLKSYSTLVPTSESSPRTWRYTTDTPPTDWYLEDFDHSNWSTGPGGFGTDGTPGAVVGTTWNSSDIWIRRDFTLPELTPDQLERVTLRIHHDEDAHVYINNIPARNVSGYTTSYVRLAISEIAAANLRPSQTNTIAIHCRQTGGGQFIDAGLDLEALPDDHPCPTGFPPADLNQDCRTNLPDFALMLHQWLNCSTPNTPPCTQPD